MTCASASWIFTSRPNSVGLFSFPLRMMSVCGSNRLTTLPGVMRVPAEHAGPRLRQDLPDEVDRLGQLRGGAFAARASHRALGLAQHRAGDPHEARIQNLHLRLASHTDRCGPATPRGAT